MRGHSRLWWYNLSSSGSSSFPSASGRTLVPKSPALCPQKYPWTPGRYPKALSISAACVWWRGVEAPHLWTFVLQSTKGPHFSHLVSHYFCHYVQLLTVDVDNSVFGWYSPLAHVLLSHLPQFCCTTLYSVANQPRWAEVLWWGLCVCKNELKPVLLRAWLRCKMPWNYLRLCFIQVQASLRPLPLNPSLTNAPSFCQFQPIPAKSNSFWS